MGRQRGSGKGGGKEPAGYILVLWYPFLFCSSDLLLLLLLLQNQPIVWWRVRAPALTFTRETLRTQSTRLSRSVPSQPSAATVCSQSRVCGCVLLPVCWCYRASRASNANANVNRQPSGVRLHGQASGAVRAEQGARHGVRLRPDGLREDVHHGRHPGTYSAAETTI